MTRETAIDRLEATSPRVDYRRVGCRIAEQRQARGWKIRELGRRAGIEPTRLSRLERGVGQLRIEELVGLCHALGVGYGEMLFGEGPRDEDEIERLVREARGVASPGDEALFARLLRLFVLGLRTEGA